LIQDSLPLSSPAVAKAAIDSGVARKSITDWDAYELELQERIGIDQRLMSVVIARAKKDPKRVVFAEADNRKILKAAQIIRDEKIAQPILLGNKEKILDLDSREFSGFRTCHHHRSARRN
jgi:Phosphotransacetylase